MVLDYHLGSAVDTPKAMYDICIQNLASVIVFCDHFSSIFTHTCNVLFQRDFAEKLNREKNRKAANVQKYEEKFKDMQSTIQRNESIIHMLKMQLAQYQKEEVWYNMYLNL